MDKFTQMYVPLVNPNENESVLVRLFVKNGQKVKKEEILAVFETTKSTLELTTDRAGFVLGLTIKEGDTLAAGKPLCVIADTPDEVLPQQRIEIEKPREQFGAVPDGLRITQPALALARQHTVDLAALPKDQLVTETFIRARIKPLEVTGTPNALVIYGGGGHAKSLIDLIRAEGKFTVAGILDDGVAAGTNVMDIPVLGDGELLAELRQKGISKAINAVGGIGSITPRLAVYEKLKAAGFTCPTVIHPRAYIEPGAEIGDGGQIFFNAYIGSEVKIGFGCIVNTGAIISHDCILRDYVNISPGAILAGAVTVNERSLVGMGVTINLHVTIGANSRVGNSAVVKADVPQNGIVRAGTIWPLEHGD
jgi:sugar O-acyltransferase (sialic acid O-acetyltransferase NeuD family)